MARKDRFVSGSRTLISAREAFLAAIQPKAALPRASAARYDGLRLGLNPFFALVIGSRDLALFLQSREGDRIAVASVSQFEAGHGSGRYLDFAFMARAKPEWAAPVLHGDLMLPMAGAHGALYLDYYDPTRSLWLPDFIRGREKLLLEAMDALKPWWNRRRFGKLTPHLDPWKSRYRIEALEPVRVGDQEVSAFFAAACHAISTYLFVWLESLEALECPLRAEDKNRNTAGIERFVQTLHTKDPAARLGKALFTPGTFRAFFLDGFWGIGLDGPSGAEESSPPRKRHRGPTA